jgi:hypothetical protein
MGAVSIRFQPQKHRDTNLRHGIAGDKGMDALAGGEISI